MSRDRWMRMFEYWVGMSWMIMFKYWVGMSWMIMFEYWVGMSWMRMFEYWVGMSWMRMILLARCFLLFLEFIVSSCKNSRRERWVVVKFLKMKSFQVVLRIRIRIRWIRKIFASWIRLLKNMRIHGFRSKRQNINPKKNYSQKSKPKSELLKQREIIKIPDFWMVHQF